jgi:hypothetical protein
VVPGQPLAAVGADLAMVIDRLARLARLAGLAINSTM